jgi:hypothetical protein
MIQKKSYFNTKNDTRIIIQKLVSFFSYQKRSRIEINFKNK